MNRQRPDLLGQGILFTVTTKVQRFRLLHAWGLAFLGLGLIGAAVSLDRWVPRWVVYVLTVLLVLDALLHAAINRWYSAGEIEAWQQVLGLADAVMHQARVDAATQRTPTKKPEKSLFGPKPPFRVVRPDEEPPKKG